MVTEHTVRGMLVITGFHELWLLPHECHGLVDANGRSDIVDVHDGVARMQHRVGEQGTGSACQRA